MPAFANVALLAEGVGRNTLMEMLSLESAPVALLAEGVGRNIADQNEALEVVESPSSRRAWVEIAATSTLPPMISASPSSRRAWVEIPLARLRPARVWVALLAEGVDRNYRHRGLAAGG